MFATLIVFAVFSFFSFAGKPPVSSFAYVAGAENYGVAANQNSYGIPCEISSIHMEGVDEILNLVKGKIQHNKTTTVKCKTNEGYYDLKTSGPSYSIKCVNGTIETNSMCVKKCKLRATEFMDEALVKGRDFQESGASQFKMKAISGAFDFQSGNAIPSLGGNYYVTFGDTVKIQCPEGFPPYHSDSAIVAKSNQQERTFETRCLPTSTPQENEWSVKMTCYDGMKACANSEITVLQENEQCNEDGCFFARGGEKMVPDGYTPHGGNLQLNCSNIVYKDRFVSPKCNNGVWSSKVAYCAANYCTPAQIVGSISNVSHNIGLVNRADFNKRIYHRQQYTYKCQQHNRIGASEGKTFRCDFSQEDDLTVVPIDVSNSKYCVQNACQININGIDFNYISSGESYTQTSSSFDSWVSCWGICGASAGAFYGTCQRSLLTFICNNRHIQSSAQNQILAWKASGIDGRGYGTYGSDKWKVDLMMNNANNFCRGHDQNRARNLYLNDYTDSGWYDGYPFSDSDWNVRSPYAGRVLCNKSKCWQNNYYS